MGAVLVVAVVVAGFTGCGSRDEGRSAVADDPCFSADRIVPSDTVENLVTYADEMAVVEVVDDDLLEYDKPDDGLELERYRQVTIEAVEVVWRAPQHRTVPHSATFTTSGWVNSDPRQGPRPECGQPALEVGRRYLVGMVEYAKGEWAPMSGPFVLNIDRAGVVHGVVEEGPLSRYNGRLPSEVGAALVDVVPDPAVEPFRDQPGGLRFRAAYAED